MSVSKKRDYKTTNEVVKFIWFLAEFQVILLIYKTKLWKNMNT